MNRRLAFAWEVAQLSPSDDGLTFRVRRVGDTLHAPYSYRLPRSHGAFEETFELLLASIKRGLVVEVTAEDEPDELGHLAVTSVSLNGQG
jgi:hypothetical protein